MILRFVLIVAAALAAVLLAVPVWADAMLRPIVTVTGDQIHLGDLFDGIGAKADLVVARAPAPGHRAVVEADWLQRVATLNGLDWKTENPFLELVIERPGATISRERIEQEVIAALAHEGVPADAQVEIANRDLQMVIPTDVPETVAIRDLNFDSVNMRFSAVVEAPADGVNPVRLSVAGKIYDVAEVPTLAHPVGRGDVIAARDLTFARMRKATVRRDVLLDADQIIGMTPRSTLRTGQMVTIADLQHPVVVTRGALVTVVLHEGAMSLSIQGRAIEGGSVGDLIRVTNTRSNQTVQARVEGTNIVSVGMGSAPLPSGIALAN